MTFDWAIVGAGVIGSALGAGLKKMHPEWDILILEQLSKAGQGITSRNSEIIHAGIYYPSDWLKSRLAISPDIS